MSIKDKFASNIAEINVKREVKRIDKRNNKQSTPLLRTSGPICFTGPGPYPRHRLNAIARGAGYEPENRVRNGTSYLVTDDPNRMTVKRRTAVRLGVPIISYQQFLTSIL